jgi:transposase
MVLYRELRAMAYDGTERTVRRFVAGSYPMPQPEPVVRYETAPGHPDTLTWARQIRLEAPKCSGIDTEPGRHLFK